MLSRILRLLVIAARSILRCKRGFLFLFFFSFFFSLRDGVELKGEVIRAKDYQEALVIRMGNSTRENR